MASYRAEVDFDTVRVETPVEVDKKIHNFKYW